MSSLILNNPIETVNLSSSQSTDSWDEILIWLKKQPSWLQLLSQKILERENIQEPEFLIETIISLIKNPKDSEDEAEDLLVSLRAKKRLSCEELKITKIGPIRGVDRLNTKNPLDFPQDKNLIIIYGFNGSGKSSYTRILKKISGKSTAKELKENVYKQSSSERDCQISYRKGSEPEFTCTWDVKSQHIVDLQNIDIFDSETGRSYFNKTSISYEPEETIFFKDLVQFTIKIKEKLSKEKASFERISLPQVPEHISKTEAIKQMQTWLNGSNNFSFLKWSKADDTRLQNEQKKLTEDPQKIIESKENTNKERSKILKTLQCASQSLNIEQCKNIMNLKQSAKEKREIALNGSIDFSDSNCLNGIGSETWRALWNAAREYSKQEAYKDKSFPFIESGANCVLCHQTLSQDAVDRLERFDKYVKNELEIVAQQEEDKLNKALTNLPEIQNKESVRTSCQASGLNDNWVSKFLNFWEELSKLKEWILKNEVIQPSNNFDQNSKLLIEEMESEITSLNQEINSSRLILQGFDRVAISQSIAELQARKWISDNETAITQEKGRQQEVSNYEDWIQQTDTTGISRQAGIVSQKLITQAYKQRFDEELVKLCGNKKISVQLSYASTERGQAKHEVKLTDTIDTKMTPLEILSEGEKRIIELTTFLADVAVNQNRAPFVFDDPISSLDQEFEERTAARLIELSSHRQVIILTHRLSLLNYLMDKGDSIDVLYLENRIDSSGEPAMFKIDWKKPQSALKQLLNDKLSKVKKAYDNSDSGYDELVLSICTDFRKVLERIIEKELLRGIIERHRRDVQTKGKLEKLHLITHEDTQLLERFMMKYSCDLHSQSPEAPRVCPSPQELHNDISEVQNWLDEYKRR